MTPSTPPLHSRSAEGGVVVSLVGEVAVTRADGSRLRLRGRQPQLVLGYLLLEGRTVERFELAELLWGEQLPEHWAGAVRGVLSKVRSWLSEAALSEAGLPAAGLVAEDGLVRLRLPAGVVTDVELARSALGAAQRSADAGRLDEAAEIAAGAAALLDGPFLPHGDGDWATRQRDQYEGLVGTAARMQVRALLEGGDPARAVQLAADRVGRDSLDESAHHLLIRALLACGRRADAARAYDDLAEVLARELGIEPSGETTALIDRGPAPPSRGRRAADLPSTPPPAPAPTPDRDRDRDRDRRTTEPFVGRRGELEALLATWAATAAAGTPHLVTISGDAGIGKTRLAAELGRRAGGEVQVRWGRCRAASGLAFEPVVELLADAVRDDPGLLARIGPAAGHLSPLLPDLRLPPVTGALDAALERTQLFGAVTATVAEVAGGPTVWIVDDIQWASPDTVALLEVVLERVRRPLLVVATYRGRSAAIEASLARLQRTVPSTSIELAGLDEDDLREVVRSFADPGAPHPAEDAAEDDLVRDLRRRTGGIPFFVAEIAQEARRSGVALDPDRIPKTARQWIERRAGALDPQVAAVLDLCAVIGIDIDLDLLAACHTPDADALALACETLLDHGLLVDPADPGETGRLSFPHLISRDAIYERLRSPRRLQLHRRVVDTLEDQPTRPGRDALLAHHLARLGPEAAPRAALHACAAGDDALTRSAWALAAEHFDAAAGLARGDAGLRARALIGSAQARYRSRDLAGARASLDEAIALAREHGRPIDMARAALQLVGRAGRGAAIDMTDADREALLREALAGLEARPRPEEGEGEAAEEAVDTIEPTEREALLCEVEGELALALLFADAADEREALVARTLARTRAAQPPVPRHLARALLNRRFTTLDPAQLPRRLADADEILAMAPGVLHPEQVVAALAYQHEDRLLTGDRAGARASLAALTDTLHAAPHPYWGWVGRTWTALGHLVDGDVAQAEVAAVDAAAHQPGDQGESAACLGVNLVSVRLWQGRSVEVIDLVADAADAFPQVPCYRAVLALCASKAGRSTAADAAYRRFADHDFAVPADTNRFLTFAVLADVAVDLGDSDGAARLATLLAPYAGLQVLLNCYGGGGAYWGPADHQRARLARLAGRDDEAGILFARAISQADRFGAPLAQARVTEDRDRAAVTAAP